MADITTRFKLDDYEEQRAAELCVEFDHERLIPAWARERGRPEDWEGRLRAERHVLRQELELAVLVGGVLENLGHPWWGESLRGKGHLVG